MENKKRKFVGDQRRRREDGPKIMAPILDEPMKGCGTLREDVKTETLAVRYENYERKTRNIISKSVSASVILRLFISLCLSKTVDSLLYSVPLFSTTTNEGVIQKKIVSTEPTYNVCVFITFS